MKFTYISLIALLLFFSCSQDKETHEDQHEHETVKGEDIHEHHDEHKPSMEKEMPAHEESSMDEPMHGHDYVDEATLKKDITVSEKSMDELIHSYMFMKDALVADDKEKAAITALKMHKTIATLDEAETLNMLSEAAMSVHTAEDIGEQRQAFSQVSGIVTAIAKDNDVNSVLYRQYCPMAFDNKGAYWLSSSEEIRNPYFGDAMLKCGSVKEKIK